MFNNESINYARDVCKQSHVKPHCDVLWESGYCQVNTILPLAMNSENEVCASKTGLPHMYTE